METTITVFAVMMAIAFVTIGFGFFMRKSLIAIMGGVLILAMSVGITAFIISNESVYVEGVVSNVTSGWHWENTTSYLSLTSSAASDVNTATRKSLSEYASTGSSLLVGDLVNCIDIGLSKTGTPSNATSDVTIGIFGPTANVLYTFGTQDETALTTSHTIRTYCNTGSIHTMANGDRMGVKFELADATNKVQLRTDAAGAFDGTVTFVQTYASGAWGSSTASDMMAHSYYRQNVTDTEPLVLASPSWVDHQVSEEIDSTARFILGFFGVVFIVAPILTFKGFTI